MNTLSRYLLKEFLKPLIFTIMVFVGLYVIAELVDEMRSFVNHKPSVFLIFLYYIYRIPYFVVQILPLAVLLSSLFSLGQLGRNNELIAMRSCGISFLRVVTPILIASFTLVLVVLFFNELVIPYTNPRAHHIKRVGIEKKTDHRLQLSRDWITRSVSGRRVLHTRHLDAAAGHMRDIILIQLDENMQIKVRLDAPRAVWQSGNWLFENGVLRHFDANGVVTHYNKFARHVMPFKETPKDFIREEKKDDQLLSMPLKELTYQIQLLRETGIDPRKEEVNFHLKIAFPFANFILALLGVSLPFVFPTGRRTIIWTAIGFVITIITGFFYIGFIAVGTSFGKNGMLPPIVSVWVANVVFTSIGILFMTKAKS